MAALDVPNVRSRKKPGEKKVAGLTEVVLNRILSARLPIRRLRKKHREKRILHIDVPHVGGQLLPDARLDLPNKGSDRTALRPVPPILPDHTKRLHHVERAGGRQAVRLGIGNGQVHQPIHQKLTARIEVDGRVIPVEQVGRPGKVMTLVRQVHTKILVQNPLRFLGRRFRDEPARTQGTALRLAKNRRSKRIALANAREQGLDLVTGESPRLIQEGKNRHPIDERGSTLRNPWVGVLLIFAAVMHAELG